MEERISVGIVGCGNISSAYIRGCSAFHILDVVACADILADRAESKAEEHGIEKACSVEEMLSDPDIQIVINLTVPAAHAKVSLAAIDAGKSVHSEKPLAVTRAEGRRIITAARRKGVLVGCAPDTFLGGGLQTCRKLLDDGWIGRPVSATAFTTGHGPETWHPDPEIFYQVGAGPMFDMGPYYLTALVHLLGPIIRVTGSTSVAFPERLITSQPHRGDVIAVRTPTHYAGVLDFAAGATATLITSFDIWAANLPRIEIYGTEGSLSVPDPNGFGGPVRLRRLDAEEWTDMPLSHNADVGRGIGVADTAYALVSGRQHRASGDLAYHILDVMHAFEEASAGDNHVHIQSSCARPAMLPVGLMQGELDA